MNIELIKYYKNNVQEFVQENKQTILILSLITFTAIAALGSGLVLSGGWNALTHNNRILRVFPIGLIIAGITGPAPFLLAERIYKDQKQSTKERVKSAELEGNSFEVEEVKAEIFERGRNLILLTIAVGLCALGVGLIYGGAGYIKPSEAEMQLGFMCSGAVLMGLSLWLLIISLILSKNETDKRKQNEWLELEELKA